MSKADMSKIKRKMIFFRIIQIFCIACVSFFAFVLFLQLLELGRSKGYEGPIATYEDTLFYEKDYSIYEYRPQTGSHELVNEIEGDFCLQGDTIIYVKDKQLNSFNVTTGETNVIYECGDDISMSVHGPKEAIILVYLQRKDGTYERDYLYEGQLVFENYKESSMFSEQEPDWETLNQQYGESIYVYDKWGNTEPEVQSIAESMLTISYARQAGDYVYIVVPYKNTDNLYCYYPMCHANGIVYGLEEVDVLLPENALGNVENVISALSFTTNAIFSIFIEVLFLVVLLVAVSKKIKKLRPFCMS